ncbi:unnamed protein product [Prunus brigantina]
MSALVEGVTSPRVREGASKLRKGACRREGLTSACLPKGRCDVTACSRGCFQASEGSMPKGSCDVSMPSEGKGRCDVITCLRGCFQASEGSMPKGRLDVSMPSEGKVEGVTSSRVREGASKLRKGACRREGLTSACLPKGRCDVIACSRGCFQASEGSMPKGRFDHAFRREGVTSSRVREGASKLRKGACRREGVTSQVPCGSGMETLRRGNRGVPTMSDNSERESQSPHSPHAFSGEEFESGSQNEDLGLDGESTGSEGVGEGLIVGGGRVGEEEQSRSSGGEAYKEMQRNYVALEACANRVLGITQAPEASASGRVGPSGFGTVVVASADVGVPVGVPLPKKNMMSLYELESLKVDYAIPDCVGLRLPIPAEAARYPPEGCVMVFSAMYKHGLRLPLHPWVQMMLSRLGYAPGQYNPNFWCILHGVYIAWWLAKRGEPSFEQFIHLYSVSRQQGNFGWVQVNCRKAKERGYFIGQPPSSQKTWRNRWFFAFGDWECWPGQTVSNHVPTHFQSIGSVKCRPVSKEEEEEIELVRRLVPQEVRELNNIVTPALLLQSGLLQGMAEVPKKVVTVLEDSPKVGCTPKIAEGVGGSGCEKRPRQEGDELLAELEKKRRGLESSIHDVMGGTVLPPFDLDPPPRLPLEMEELFPAGTEDTDFASVRREAKEVTLAMHRQEVPLVNAFLTGVKIDAGELARTKATDFSDRVQKTVLSTANAFGDMYLTLARAERKVALARRHSEIAKAATAEAQAALRERNALQLKVGRLERELKETSRRLEVVEEARLETEMRRTEELAVARAEAVEEYKGSESFKNLVLDAMVEEQYGWEKMVARFNPELDINFNTSGVPPPIPSGRESLFAATPSTEATSPSEAETRGGADASGGESNLDTGAGGEEEADDRADA